MTNRTLKTLFENDKLAEEALEAAYSSYYSLHAQCKSFEKKYKISRSERVKILLHLLGANVANILKSISDDKHLVENFDTFCEATRETFFSDKEGEN